MNKIIDLNSFNEYIGHISFFSHAYLFNVNSLEKAYPYIKEFAKRIICNKTYNITCKENCNICYQIDNDEYDDLYIVNPDTISINNEEIEKLLKYMETKSIHDNGKRVYIIYGFERLSNTLSNKILKFLEEPEENIYALIMTENIDKLLPTIISRCQVYNFVFENKEEISNEYINPMKEFLSKILKDKTKTIAYSNDYLKEYLVDRQLIQDAFSTLEKIISENINKKNNTKFNEEYILKELDDLTTITLINLLDITNKLKNLIKQNINLNLLVDRYIIEISKELELCKK